MDTFRQKASGQCIIYFHGDIAGIILGIRNYLIPDYCWFPHEEIAELVH